MTDRVRMFDPVHPGELIREAIRETGWTVTEAAKRMAVTREGLSRVLSGKASITPRLAVALEQLDWSDAGHWMRIQAAYDLAQYRRRLERTVA